MKWWTAALAVSLAACKSEEKASPAELVVEPALLDFGTVGLGSESILEITISNLGGDAAGLLSVTLTEGDAGVWFPDRNGVSSIAGGETATVFVTFTPEDTQRYNGEAQIRTDLEAQASFVVGLKGVGGLSDSDDDGDGVSVLDGDCNDGDPEVYPGADERCNGQDDDCNGSVPTDEEDDDSDGYRVCDNDCDDADATVHPDAVELCDYKDTNCNGINADTDDSDGDGLSICEGDCDDTEGTVAPDQPELCDDGLDNDCDGNIDTIDLDSDGHSACGDAPDCDDNDASSYPIVVSESGSYNGIGTELEPFDNITDGIAALDGVCNTLYLLPGTYELSTSWNNGDLVIEGTSPSAVILQAPKDARHLTITGGDVTLIDLTLTGGAANEDGGSISVANASLTLSGVIVEGNHSDNDGGAVAVSSGDLTLRRSTVFENNTADDDGGALLLDASNLTDTTGTTTFLGNTGKKGGAIYLVGGSAAINGAIFRSNVATVEGGALAATGTPSSLVFEGNDLVLNDSVADGGALALRDLTVGTGFVRNNRFQDNEAGAGGGAIAIVGANSTVSVHNNTFTGNVAATEGAAIAVRLTSNADNVQAIANVMHSNDGLSALFVTNGLNPLVQYNTGFGTNSGIHFGGAIGDGSGGGLDPTNVVRNPGLVAFTADSNPDNDDLALGGSSPEIDAGPPLPSFNDTDGSPNDRGYTGGPAAE